MRRMPVRLSAVALIALLVTALFWLDGPSQLGFEALEMRRSELVGLYQRHPGEMVAVFCAVYVLITGFSLPGAAILTLAAGGIFGLVAGVVVVSIASTAGATIAFLSSRLIETAQGFVKVLTEPGRGTVLGATVVGERAGELIGEYAAAMRHGTGLSGILRTIHVYPTYAEAAKLVAGLARGTHSRLAAAMGRQGP